MSDAFYGLVAGLIMGFIIGFFIGSSMQQDAVRRQAVQHHAAHYAITNELGGTTEFQWNE